MNPSFFLGVIAGVMAVMFEIRLWEWIGWERPSREPDFSEMMLHALAVFGAVALAFIVKKKGVA